MSEKHEPWPGLTYVIEHGLPGYPAPSTAPVISDERRAAHRRAGLASGIARRAKRAAERDEWGEL
jgi:hypothetical protein